jgi:hypothetical protein
MSGCASSALACMLWNEKRRSESEKGFRLFVLTAGKFLNRERQT